jgi:transcriptional regulator with XRE-family HTH domain
MLTQTQLFTERKKGVGMNANQVIAHNLRRARTERGWTQEQAAAQIEDYLGERWSKASFSVAERFAVDTTRTREFDGNELVAIAAAFGKPIDWFFTLPDDVDQIVCGDPLDVRRPISRLQLEDMTPGGGMSHDEAITKLEEVINDLKRGHPTAKRQPRGKRVGKDD